MKPDDVVGRVPMFVVNTDRNIALQDGYFLMRQQYLSPEVRALIEAGEKAAKLEKLCPDCNYQWDDKVRETEECGNPCHDTLEAPSAPVVKEPVAGLDLERLMALFPKEPPEGEYDGRMEFACCYPGELNLDAEGHKKDCWYQAMKALLNNLPATPVEPQGQSIDKPKGGVG